jgi:carbamoyl-phosphate synthase large subunit
VINIQYVVVNEDVYVLEVNPRSSRTIPFLSKVTGVPMVKLATRIALGETLAGMGWSSGLLPDRPYIAVKAPVFSFAKMGLVEISLGPEMKSTGEVMGIDHQYGAALYKAVTAAGMNIPAAGTVLLTVADRDKEEAGTLAQRFVQLGYRLAATSGTAGHLRQLGLEVEQVHKVHEEGRNIADYIKDGHIHMVVNTLTRGKLPERDGFKIRRAAVEHAVPCLTSIDTAREMLNVLELTKGKNIVRVKALQDYIREGN